MSGTPDGLIKLSSPRPLTPETGARFPFELLYMGNKKHFTESNITRVVKSNLKYLKQKNNVTSKKY